MFHHESVPDVSHLPTGTFLLRRKLASIEGYLVYDATDTQVYRFKNHLAVATARWTMVDAAGDEVATLVRPPLHLHPIFTASRAGHPDVVIRKSCFAPIHESWRLEGGEDGDVDLLGDVLDHEFTFVAGNGRTVATATRRWVTLTDAFAVQASGLEPGAGHRRRRRRRFGRARTPGCGELGCRTADARHGPGSSDTAGPLLARS